MTSAPQQWKLSDGGLVSCREKLKTLQENHVELAQVMQDAFEDAMLMGVDESEMRRVISDMVDALRSPVRVQAGE